MDAARVHFGGEVGSGGGIGQPEFFQAKSEGFGLPGGSEKMLGKHGRFFAPAVAGGKRGYETEEGPVARGFSGAVVFHERRDVGVDGVAEFGRGGADAVFGGLGETGAVAQGEGNGGGMDAGAGGDIA